MDLTKIQKIQIKKSSFNLLPDSPGVYIYWNNSGVPIYIGKAKSLKNRLGSYLLKILETKTKKMVSEAISVSIIRVSSEIESLLLEANLIRTCQPQYNISSKDDKHPLYIKITKEEYPQILTARKVDIGADTFSSYGPFPSSKTVYSVLRVIRRIFPFADHKVGKRPCLYSHIGLCNPCPTYIESLSDPKERNKLKGKYLENIKFVNYVLGRKMNLVTKRLNRQLRSLSKVQKYEEARETLDKLNKLNYITSPITPYEDFLRNPNLVEDIRKKELKDLRDILGKYIKIKGNLRRIECFDVAHLAGTKQTASMVTFIEGEPEKRLYRHFRLFKTKRADDIAAMKEVAERRAKHFPDWGVPELIIVDGGKGQVSVFKETLSGFSVPVVGLAKRLETLVVPITRGTQKYVTFQVRQKAALNLLTRVRDEAHRFARAYHHKLVKLSLKLDRGQ